MPITNETILEANRKMLGKTNRAILFARVNMDEYLDTDVAPEEREMTPSLANMLARINDTSEEQFIAEVRENLIVTSFREFLDKFQPGFYYRVAAPQTRAGTASDDNDTTSTPSEPSSANAPGLEFSLEGGPGWKKVRITPDHPYIRCLSDLIKKRVRQDVSTFRVDVDASLFAFKPKNQRSLMRKLAEDVQVKNDRLMLEAKRNPGSKDTARALEAYQGVADEFQGALEDSVRVLPTVVYGLEQTSRELKRLPSNHGSLDLNVYQIEFGKNKQLIASPQRLPQPTAPPMALDNGSKSLAGDSPAAPQLEAGEDDVKPEKGKGALAKSHDREALSRADDRTAHDNGKGNGAIAVRSVVSALDKLREEGVKVAQQDIALVPQEKRFPIAVGKFMDKMVSRGMIQPLMGNLVATVLQNPKELALLNPDAQEIDHFHDMFLGVYSNAIGDFLKTVTPLFETIMGVYLLFNEFPADVRLSEGMKPELVIANADLPDLFLTRPEELKRYFDIACAQATNQFRDAISFAIVPNVVEFRKSRPAKKKKQDSIMLDDPLLAQIQAAQEFGVQDEDGYGRVTYKDEMLDLLEWGAQYGFQILFSPEERVRAGRAQRDFFQNLSDAYAIDQVVEQEAADCAVLCVPDFVIMPPDGKLVTGKTADGSVEIGVDVPELTVRSCFVAAGRLMANDVPDYVRRKLQHARKDVSTLRADLPGVGIDLATHPYLGETDLPTDHFLNDGVLSNLLNPDMPFLVFTHVSGRSPFLSVPRTMRRLHQADGTQSYRHLHLFRQQVYLNRLLRAAHELGFGGAWPADNAQAEAQLRGHLEYLLKWAPKSRNSDGDGKWYSPEKLVNSFPSKLQEGSEFTVQRENGNTFRVAFGFEQGLIDEFRINF